MTQDLLTLDEIKALVERNLSNCMGHEDILGLMETTDTGAGTKKVVRCGKIPQLEGSTLYLGKVRANFFGGNLIAKKGIPLRLIITTDRISTHDKARGKIPFKGEILTAISNRMLELASGSIKSSQLLAPGSAVVVSENCKPLDFEAVLRKYMAKSSTETSLYHHYVVLGKRDFCGHVLPDNLIPNGPLPYVLDTPSTKARDSADGHDESVPPQYLYDNKIVNPGEYVHVRNALIEDFGRMSYFLSLKNIIVADAKFEIGRNKNGDLVYIDEVLTPDSSRFWLASDYKEKMAKGEEPTSFSKQIGRDIGKIGEYYTDEQRMAIAVRYVETFQYLTDKRFEPDERPATERIIADINKGLERLIQDGKKVLRRNQRSHCYGLGKRSEPCAEVKGKTG